MATKHLAISKTRVLEEFAWIAFVTAANYIEFEGERASWKKWSALTPAEMAAVEKVTIDEKTGEVRYKLPPIGPKIEALTKVGVELGMFVTRKRGPWDAAGERDALIRIQAAVTHHM